jgi:hypothetical protein
MHKQTITPNATFRDGQRGELGAPDANGFASFVSITGARFTVHALECVRNADGMTLHEEIEQHRQTLAGKRITGICALTIRAERDAQGVFLGLAVTRTPTPAQCNAKRSARRVEQIGERA